MRIHDDNSKAVFYTLSFKLSRLMTIGLTVALSSGTPLNVQGTLVPPFHVPRILEVSVVSYWFLMMLYHDGLRIITAENARHSSIFSGTPF